MTSFSDFASQLNNAPSEILCLYLTARSGTRNLIYDYQGVKQKGLVNLPEDVDGWIKLDVSSDGVEYVGAASRRDLRRFAQARRTEDYVIVGPGLAFPANLNTRKENDPQVLIGTEAYETYQTVSVVKVAGLFNYAVMPVSRPLRYARTLQSDEPALSGTTGAEHYAYAYNTILAAEREAARLDYEAELARLDAELQQQLRHEAEQERIRQMMATIEGRLRHDVEFGGGEYVRHVDRNGSIMVTFLVQNRTFTALVIRNMQVESAGLCLNGTDSNYDLISLVNVINTGINRGLIVRTASWNRG